MHIRNVGMSLNPSPCQTFAPTQHDTVDCARTRAEAFVCWRRKHSRRVLSATCQGNASSKLTRRTVRRPNAGSSSRRRRDPQIVDRRDRQISRPCAASRSREPAQPVRRRRVRRFRAPNMSILRIGLDAVVHGFFVDGKMRGAAELRPLGLQFPASGRSRDQRRKALAEPRRRLGTAAADVAWPRAIAASGHLHMACLAENRRMQQLARKFDAELTFDFESVVGEVERVAADAAVADARIDVGRPRLRHGDAGSAIANVARLSLHPAPTRGRRFAASGAQRRRALGAPTSG